MSYRRRQTRIAQEHEFYDAPSGNEEAMSNDIDGYIGELTGYSPSFPGPREVRILDSENVDMPTGGIAIDSIRDNVNWDIGGVPGMTKNVGSTGVTDPQTVDQHNFVGEMAVIRRMPDTNFGPVKTADSNSLLSLLYAMQESNHYFPNEVSQADIIKAV